MAVNQGLARKRVKPSSPLHLLAWSAASMDSENGRPRAFSSAACCWNSWMASMEMCAQTLKGRVGFDMSAEWSTHLAKKVRSASVERSNGGAASRLLRLISSSCSEA